MREDVDLDGLGVRELMTLDSTPPPVEFNFGILNTPHSNTYVHPTGVEERAKHFWGSYDIGGPS